MFNEIKRKIVFGLIFPLIIILVSPLSFVFGQDNRTTDENSESLLPEEELSINGEEETVYQGISLAVVDYQRVFMEYNKTAEIREELRNNRESMLQQLDQMKNRYSTMRNNYFLNYNQYSQQEREQMATRLTELEEQIEVYIENSNRSLMEQERILKEEIQKEIQSVIQYIRLSEGYDLILDTSILLDYNPDFDLTDQVINQLNQQ